MDAFDQLDIVAEIAAALLGFFAVFLAFSRSDGRFSDSDRHFIQAIVLSASLAIVLALMPRALSFHLPVEAVWLPASVVALLLGLPAMVSVAWRQFHMSPEEAAKVHWGWHAGAWTFALAASTFFVLGILPGSNTSAYFISGATALIPLGLFCFTGVVFRRFF